MTSIREQALAAHWAAEEAAASAAEVEAGDERRERRDMEARVLQLVAESPLAEWFPNAEWEAYALTLDKSWVGMRGYGPRGESVALVGIVCTDRPSGTNPEWAGTPCFGISQPLPDDEPGKPRVFYCFTRNDEGYESWHGSEVRTLAELGRRIATHEDATRKRIQQREQARCRCFTNGQSPATISVRCASSGDHARRLRAADSSSSEAAFADNLRREEQRVRPTERGELDHCGLRTPSLVAAEQRVEDRELGTFKPRPTTLAELAQATAVERPIPMPPGASGDVCPRTNAACTENCHDRCFLAYAELT